MNIINEFFVSFILIKLYFKFKVCRKIKFPLLWKFYFSKWKFYFSADIWFEVEKEKFELNVLDMISLEANVAHSLGGLENSIIRLSLNKSDSVQRVNAVLKKP